ncbi:hypothetical protein [Bradyrhizobium cenepequi]|uniref:hypothetical protein n=1 Tax=Bradyrhizobium cenepequi TaxID=2821403 RepID=UPI001CE2D8BB|nr:hypothetical protein [Bradyrhizobium cenepequi]MCA6108000.1 hypothetical protein [Bradyrhizobium cenepequi]
MGVVAEDRPKFRLIRDWLLAEQQILKICATVRQSPKICRKDQALSGWSVASMMADSRPKIAVGLA